MTLRVSKILIDAPLTLVHLVGGVGAASLAFWLTFNGHPQWVALPIMLVCLLPDALISASLLVSLKDGRPEPGTLKSLGTMWACMACACIAILFAAWLGGTWAVLNGALSTPA